MVNLFWENEQDKVEISDKLIETLKICMEKTLEYESFEDDVEISLTVTDNEGIHEQNLAIRGIDRPTDVLSFPLLECEEDGTLIIYEEDIVDGAIPLGDIMISAEKAVSQAKEFGHSEQREFAFLTVHSMLHLLGYDHEKGEAEEKEMFEKQEEILSLLGITR
ncbi:MAG: rRNA maturation RNase YbeY [Clostridia bacterium]|nr:rRNA maturation RNase YbeY [Clostridia bacterium]